MEVKLYQKINMENPRKKFPLFPFILEILKSIGILFQGDGDGYPDARRCHGLVQTDHRVWIIAGIISAHIKLNPFN